MTNKVNDALLVNHDDGPITPASKISMQRHLHALQILQRKPLTKLLPCRSIAEKIVKRHFRLDGLRMFGAGETTGRNQRQED